MPTEVLSMLENLSATTTEAVVVTNTPEAWVITVNGVERFRFKKNEVNLNERFFY